MSFYPPHVSAFMALPSWLILLLLPCLAHLDSAAVLVAPAVIVALLLSSWLWAVLVLVLVTKNTVTLHHAVRGLNATHIGAIFLASSSQHYAVVVRVVTIFKRL